MKVGDLIIIIEQMPNWEWIDYHTGDIGIILEITQPYLGMVLLKTFIFKNTKTCKIPQHFTETLKEYK